MRPFASLLATAELHQGGPASVAAKLPVYLDADQLAAITDDRCLSTMTLRVFQAGLKHSVVAQKWPQFERHFNHFEPFRCAMISDDELDLAMANRELIRHPGKLRSIRLNAQMVRETSRNHNGFGRFLAQWPGQDIVGLWRFLKKHGCQLGGMSGARFLRLLGKDTFLLTEDVVAVLKAEGVLAKTPTSQRDMQLAQAAFNQWQGESGWPLCHISRVVSMNADAH